MKNLSVCLFISILFFSCQKDNSSTSNETIEVYSQLFVDGKEYGATEKIAKTDFDDEFWVDWTANTDDAETNIFLNYKSPEDGQIYAGLTLNKEPLMRAGSNTNCYLVMAGTTSMNGYVTVNMTKYSTKEKDIWEGTFTGKVNIYYTSNLSSKENVNCSGKFRVVSKRYEPGNGGGSNTGTQFNPNLTYGTMNDIDGNTYKTIRIGNQTWMAENLKTTKYRNGTPIQNITDNAQWQNNKTGAWSFYLNDANNNVPYGKLYNWYAVNNTNKLCPTGWHVPTDAEWTTLTNFLGGESVAGGKMMSTGTQFWSDPNSGATNSSGWSGLPGGNRGDGWWANISSCGCGLFSLGTGSWWSSTEINNNDVWFRYLHGVEKGPVKSDGMKSNGFSVRCVRD